MERSKLLLEQLDSRQRNDQACEELERSATRDEDNPRSGITSCDPSVNTVPPPSTASPLQATLSDTEIRHARLTPVFLYVTPFLLDLFLGRATFP